MKAKDYQEEYKEINGITQYFLHYPLNKSEVAVVLHGGPGQSEILFTYYLRPFWDFCSVVYYDQRGAGKTQVKSKSEANDITIEALIADLKQTIQYVKEKYQTERVILIGHSWGTVLGKQYIQKYPEDVMCYIGYGQVIDMLQGEQIAYDKLRKAIEDKGKKNDLLKLSALGNYPNDITKENFLKIVLSFRRLQRKYRFTGNYSKAFRVAMKSPHFTARDIFSLSAKKILKLNRNLLNMLLNFRIRDTDEYHVPVFYIVGKDDWQTPSILTANYYNKIVAPLKGIYRIENAGHLMDIDKPEQFCEIVKKILMQL
ncbi:MAG: alpha/beta hydrolase [Lachnospiraceae bacterium]|nr:alpha/beta hydrolase [Lachnospiraceae bacterium]